VSGGDVGGDVLGGVAGVWEPPRARECTTRFLCGPEAAHHGVGRRVLVSFQKKPIVIQIDIRPDKADGSGHTEPSKHPASSGDSEDSGPAVQSMANTNSSEPIEGSACCLCNNNDTNWSNSGTCSLCGGEDTRDRTRVEIKKTLEPAPECKAGKFEGILDNRECAKKCRSEFLARSRCCLCENDQKKVFSMTGNCEECGDGKYKEGDIENKEKCYTSRSRKHRTPDSCLTDECQEVGTWEIKRNAILLDIESQTQLLRLVALERWRRAAGRQRLGAQRRRRQAVCARFRRDGVSGFL